MEDIVTKIHLPDELISAIRSATISAINDAREQALGNQYPLYLSKQEAARYLRISVNTLNEWMSQSTIPFKRIGKTYRFNRKQLDEFMTND